MNKPENGPLQGRFEVSGGVLKIDEPYHVSKNGKPVRLITGDVDKDIEYEMALLRELGHSFDAGADIGDQYPEVIDRLKEKFTLSGERKK